jgi:putative PIN family toxin of toxin-antitoxin system
MRVVLDTNILISACWKPGGLEEQVIEVGLAGHFTMAASPALWAEYVEVLARPKFLKLKPRIDTLFARLEAKVLKTATHSKLTLASDPDDNIILECALDAGANYIITGNLKHYPLDWPVARIVNARQFFDQTGYCNLVASAVP